VESGGGDSSGAEVNSEFKPNPSTIKVSDSDDIGLGSDIDPEAVSNLLSSRSNTTVTSSEENCEIMSVQSDINSDDVPLQ